MLCADQGSRNAAQERAVDTAAASPQGATRTEKTREGDRDGPQAGAENVSYLRWIKQFIVFLQCHMCLKKCRPEICT